MAGEESPLGLLEPPKAICDFGSHVRFKMPRHDQCLSKPCFFFRGEREKAVPNMSRQRRDQSTQHMGYIILVGTQRTHAATRTACCAGVTVIQLLVFLVVFFRYRKTRRCLPLLPLRVPMFSTDARRKG